MTPSFPRITAKAKLKWAQVMWVVFYWCLVSIFLAFYKCVNYDPASEQFIFAAPKGYSVLEFVFINLIGPFFAGFTGGALIVFVLMDRLRSKSYLRFISTLSVVFFSFILVLNTAVSFIFYYRDHASTGKFAWSDFVANYLIEPYAIRNILTWMVIGFVTVTILKISDRYGPGVFRKFILGKYFHPQEEERIFMFLDLNDSTSLAEKLGNMQFFNLLNSYFSDSTTSILNSGGEIYQYVGDEIVVSWAVTSEMRFTQCIKCFFDIEKAIQDNAQAYQQEYGVIPTFKAGMHIGTVIVGQMGIIKKDIVYSGDILNTTARVLELCKNYQQKLIISKALYDRVKEEQASFYYSPLGHIHLRGKGQFIELVAVSMNY